jgi:hypothetical protein
MAKSTQQECFVIMPISDHEGYEKGHFKRVYEDVIIPACEKSDYKAVRADEVEETDIIHLSILKKLIEAPMAICDLSTRNPNVLFELGLRQAFDKPVVLIQEKGTERIFDVSILRAYDYCKELKYKEVLEDQEAIAKMLKGTEKAFVTGEGFNSVIKLLSLSKGAQIKSIDDPNEQLKMQLFQLSSQMQDVSDELRRTRNNNSFVINNRENINSNIRHFRRNDGIESLYERFIDANEKKDFESMLKIFEIAKTSEKNSELSNAIIQDMERTLSSKK